MKKYKLQDLVANGSNARRRVDSDVLVGDVSAGYGYGDILDANATSQLVSEKITEVTQGAIKEDLEDELEELRNKNEEQDQEIQALKDNTSQKSRVEGETLIIL